MYEQAHELAAKGHEVTVATGGAQRASRVDGEARVRIEEFAISGADFLLHPIRGEVAGYVGFLSETMFDAVILHAWQNWATDLALMSIDRIGGRKFLFSHCISTNIFFFNQPIRSLIRYLAWRPYWWALPDKLKKLDGVFFLGESGSDSRFDDLRVAVKYGVKKYIIPNSLSSVGVRALGEQLENFSNRTQLIAVGSYQWQKGFDFVLRAYAQSKSKNRIGLKLFGQEHTKYSENLYILAKQLGLSSQYVSFHEHVSGDRLLAEYRHARLLLSGSHTECQPLALLDANATGTPFIARATGCIATMPGGMAVGSVEEMASQIDVFCNNQDIWCDFSRAGRNAAREIYHPLRTTELLLNVLLENVDTLSGVVP